ncbi:MAG: hypothetical protein QOI59_4366 [Gammaproteobacteria bacterium]|nr:hypothetical protein [Gammaproteobacteria bacterium]
MYLASGPDVSNGRCCQPQVRVNLRRTPLWNISLFAQSRDIGGLFQRDLAVQSLLPGSWKAQ